MRLSFLIVLCIAISLWGNSLKAKLAEKGTGTVFSSVDHDLAQLIALKEQARQKPDALPLGQMKSLPEGLQQDGAANLDEAMQALEEVIGDNKAKSEALNLLASLYSGDNDKPGLQSLQKE
jgi:hypothetical protein